MVWLNTLNKALRASVILVALSSPTYAASPITFDKLSLPEPVNQNAVAYFTITSETDDKITGAASDCCQAVELHEHQMDGSVMRMRKVDFVPLPAGKPVHFEHMGYHVMLIGLKKPLKKGDRVSVTFSFDRAPLQRVDFTVSARDLQGSM